MPGRQLLQFQRVLRHDSGTLTPRRLAEMLDELDDFGFLSAAQAAELLRHGHHRLPLVPQLGLPPPRRRQTPHHRMRRQQ